MLHPRSNPRVVLDYDVADDATEIDIGPHWSASRRSLQVLPRPVQISAAGRVALPPPLRAPVAFYSYAEESARRHCDTERVVPLSMSDLESPWLTNTWQRFAAPACGLIAALIFVVGYLAYSSQGGAVATAAAPAPAIVMPVDVAVSEEAPVEVEAPSATETIRAETVPATSKHAATKRIAAKKRVTSTSSKTKRRPIRFDASTPLGNLRPSRSF